jgi:hypothetical protein
VAFGKKRVYRSLSHAIMKPDETEALLEDDRGRWFVMRRNGDFVEVREADAEGKPIATKCIGGDDDPDEHCEELLQNFARQASIEMLQQQQQPHHDGASPGSDDS